MKVTTAGSRRFGSIRVHTLVTGDVWRQNCYLMQDLESSDWAIVDPGGEGKCIADFVEERGGGIRHIFLTHGHHDHVGGLADLAERAGVPGRLSAADARLAQRAPTYALSFHGLRIRVPGPIETFDDEPFFALGQQRIGVWHTPGHSAGSVSFLIPGCVFSGDTLLRMKVGRSDLAGGDALALERSVEGLLSLPPETVILSGHGQPWLIGEARFWWKSGAGRSTHQRAVSHVQR